MRRGPILAAAVVGGLVAFGSLTAFAAPDLGRAIGKALFKRAWVPAPSSTHANDGLGPLFNARACIVCHQGLERAALEVGPDGLVTGDNVVVRFSDAAGNPDPVYGIQFQTAAIPGHVPEGKLVRAANGKIEPQGLAFGPLAPTTHFGLRVAPALHGLGELASVPSDAILALADPDDLDGDGISGRPNWITGSHGRKELGRFGWKANEPSLSGQISDAFSMDLGMSTEHRPSVAGDCTPGEAACEAGPHGGTADEPEISHEIVALLASYLASVPGPKPEDANDPKGAQLFASAGCAACHQPSLPSTHGKVAAFTDLLLHDMGPGLDGGATEPGVAPTEWRTAPLWGVRRTVASGAGLLHDGRARSVTEAIEWHGGEGAHARSAFQALSESDRKALIAYVEKL